MIKVTRDDFLFHFGIPGMKWGKRKTSKDSERVAKLKTKKLHELSNEELRDLTQRMQLERSLKDLKKSKSTGQKIVKEILLSVGKQQAAIALTPFVAAGVGAVSVIIKQLIKK